MNGLEHYQEAERLLARAKLAAGTIEAGFEPELAAAQVHATLALGAFTVDTGVCLCGKPARHIYAPEDSPEWACRVPRSGS